MNQTDDAVDTGMNPKWKKGSPQAYVLELQQKARVLVSVAQGVLFNQRNTLSSTTLSDLDRDALRKANSAVRKMVG